jgi:flavin-binding protein dodecin
MGTGRRSDPGRTWVQQEQAEDLPGRGAIAPGVLVRASEQEDAMSVYRVIDVIGTSTQSWEDAAATAVKTASQTLRDLRVAEVVEQDLHIEEEGGAIIFRTRLRLSFKYDVGHAHLHQ